jgi:hypothetical protein
MTETNMTEEKLIGNLLGNQARVAESHCLGHFIFMNTSFYMAKSDFSCRILAKTVANNLKVFCWVGYW